MAFQTECPDIFEIAFAAALYNWNDMVGVPKAFPDAQPRAQAPVGERLLAANTAQALQMFPGRNAIHAALRAHALVALQDSFANITGIGAQPPLRDAPVRAERMAPVGHLETAPAAKIPPIRAFWEAAAVGPAARHCADSTHGSII